MGTYRGAGGSSDSTTTATLADVTAQAQIAIAKASEASLYETSVHAIHDELSTDYLGALSNEPSVGYQGVALTNGVRFWDTNALSLKVYSGGTWYLTGENGADGESAEILKSPTLTYTAGVLTSIAYDDSKTKTFTYTSGVLTSIAFYNGAVTTTKTLNYTSNVLTSITES
mgnify:CR=1 FL=1